MTIENIRLSPVSRSRLHERIAFQLQKMIVEGTLPVGEKLPTERELASRFNVNRNTVREALKRLEMLDLIEIRHGDGIYVKHYLESGNLELLKQILYMNNESSTKIIADLLFIRRILAPEIAARAAERCSQEDLENYDSIISDKAISLLEKDLRIHQFIARASNNILYIFILNFFNQIFRDFGHFYFDDEKNRSVSERFHRNLYIALKTRDVNRTRKIMEEVMKYSEEHMYNKNSGSM